MFTSAGNFSIYSTTFRLKLIYLSIYLFIYLYLSISIYLSIYLSLVPPEDGVVDVVVWRVGPEVPDQIGQGLGPHQLPTPLLRNVSAAKQY